MIISSKCIYTVNIYIYILTKITIKRPNYMISNTENDKTLTFTDKNPHKE